MKRSWLAKKLPSEMIPSQDQSNFVLRIKGPPGSALPLTDSKIRMAEDYLLKQPDVDGVFAMVGGFGGDAVAQGMVNVMLVPPNKRKMSQKQIMIKFRDALRPMMKPYQAVGQDLSMRGFASTRGFPVEFTVQGQDWDKLYDLVADMMDKLDDSGIVTETNTDIQEGNPEVHARPNRKKIADHGVSLTQVAQGMNTLFSGALLNGQVEYPKAGHRYEIEVRLPPDERDQKDQLRNIKIPNNRGEVIPLADLVDVVEEPALQQISRLNR